LHSKPTACEKWHELCGLLQARNQLDLCDFDLLSLYCEAWQQIVDADALLNSEGEVLYGEKGGAYMHPAAHKRNIAMDRVTRIAKELGIGFRARKGTATASSSEESELDSF
jgi:P27 family predicted phage terminase small subunit